MEGLGYLNPPYLSWVRQRSGSAVSAIYISSELSGKPLRFVTREAESGLSLISNERDSTHRDDSDAEINESIARTTEIRCKSHRLVNKTDSSGVSTKENLHNIQGRLER